MTNLNVADSEIFECLTNYIYKTEKYIRTVQNYLVCPSGISPYSIKKSDAPLLK